MAPLLASGGVAERRTHLWRHHASAGDVTDEGRLPHLQGPWPALLVCCGQVRALQCRSSSERSWLSVLQ